MCKSVLTVGERMEDLEMVPAGCAPLHQTHCLCPWRLHPARTAVGAPHTSDGRGTPHAI